MLGSTVYNPTVYSMKFYRYKPVGATLGLVSINWPDTYTAASGIWADLATSSLFRGCYVAVLWTNIWLTDPSFDIITAP